MRPKLRAAEHATNSAEHIQRLEIMLARQQAQLDGMVLQQTQLVGLMSRAARVPTSEAHGREGEGGDDGASVASARPS